MKPKIFIDTEFIEAGPNHPVRLISIGLVKENGDEYYAIDANCDYSKASPWVIENVIPHLDMKYVKTRNQIKGDIIEFINDPKKYEDRPEIWGWYGSYDMLILCQIFGKAINTSSHFSMGLMDIKQYAMRLGNPELPKSDGALHNALEDAKWHKKMYDFLVEYEKKED